MHNQRQVYGVVVSTEIRIFLCTAVLRVCVRAPYVRQRRWRRWRRSFVNAAFASSRQISSIATSSFVSSLSLSLHEIYSTNTMHIILCANTDDSTMLTKFHTIIVECAFAQQSLGMSKYVLFRFRNTHSLAPVSEIFVNALVYLYKLLTPHLLAIPLLCEKQSVNWISSIHLLWRTHKKGRKIVSIHRLSISGRLKGCSHTHMLIGRKQNLTAN